MSLFGNSRRIATFHKQTNYDKALASRTTKERDSFTEEREELGGIVLNKSSLEEDRSLTWWHLPLVAGQGSLLLSG